MLIEVGSIEFWIVIERCFGCGVVNCMTLGCFHRVLFITFIVVCLRNLQYCTKVTKGRL